MIIPEYAGVANAIGATTCQISGEIDVIVAMEGKNREEILNDLKNKAKDMAITNGVESNKKNEIEITQCDEFPLAYVPGNATRFVIKAVGNFVPKIDNNHKFIWDAKKYGVTKLNQTHTHTHTHTHTKYVSNFFLGVITFK